MVFKDPTNATDGFSIVSISVFVPFLVSMQELKAPTRHSQRRSGEPENTKVHTKSLVSSSLFIEFSFFLV